MEGDQTLDDKYTMQFADDVLQNFTPETFIILLTSVSPINEMKIYK